MGAPPLPIVGPPSVKLFDVLKPLPIVAPHRSHFAESGSSWHDPRLPSESPAVFLGRPTGPQAGWQAQLLWVDSADGTKKNKTRRLPEIVTLRVDELERLSRTRTTALAAARARASTQPEPPLLRGSHVVGCRLATAAFAGGVA